MSAECDLQGIDASGRKLETASRCAQAPAASAVLAAVKAGTSELPQERPSLTLAVRDGVRMMIGTEECSRRRSQIRMDRHGYARREH